MNGRKWMAENESNNLEVHLDRKLGKDKKKKKMNYGIKDKNERRKVNKNERGRWSK